MCKSVVIVRLYDKLLNFKEQKLCVVDRLDKRARHLLLALNWWARKAYGNATLHSVNDSQISMYNQNQWSGWRRRSHIVLTRSPDAPDTIQL